MDPMATSLLGNVLLLAALLMMQPLLRVIREGISYSFGSQDEQRPEGSFAGRVTRLKNNQIEALALFIPIVILSSSFSSATPLMGQAAMIFLAARLAYTPVFLMGVPYLRSLLWGIGLFAWLFMVLNIAGINVMG